MDTILENLKSLFHKDMELALVMAEAGRERRLLGVQVCQQLAASAHQHGQDLTVSKWQAACGSHKMGGGIGTVNAAKVAGVAALVGAWDLDWNSSEVSPGTLLTLVEKCRKEGALELAKREVRGKMTPEEVRDALKAIITPPDPVQDRVDYIVKNVRQLTDEQRQTLIAVLA